MKKTLKKMMTVTAVASILTGAGFVMPVAHVMTPMVAAQELSTTVKVDPVKVGDTKITGTAPAGTKIVLETKDPEKPIEVTAGQDGKWEINLPTDGSIELVEGEDLILKVIEVDETETQVKEKIATAKNPTEDPAEDPTEDLIEDPTDSPIEEATTEEPIKESDSLSTITIEAPLRGTDSSTTTTTEVPVKETEAPTTTAETTTTTEVTEAETTTTTEAPELKNFITIEPFLEGTKLISGMTSPKATVLMRNEATGDKFVVVANDKGEWTIELKDPIKKGDSYQVTSNSVDNQDVHTLISIAPEQTTTTEQTQETKQATNFVKVNDILAGTKKISGTSTPNATVLVFVVKTQDKLVVDADSQGNWSVEVPANVNLQAGDLVNVTSNSKENITAFQQVKVLPGVSVDKNKSLLPDTGENTGYLGIFGLVMVIAGSFILFSKKVNLKHIDK